MHILSQMPVPSKKLPLTFISLSDWILIKISGLDTIKYLQGQLTCNMSDITEDTCSFASYCNAKGKMISNMYIFNFQDGIGCIQRRSVYNRQIEIMKKYNIFYKVDIAVNNTKLLFGLAGDQAKEILCSKYNILPDKTKNIISYKDNLFIYLHSPIERFLIIANKKLQDKLLEQLRDRILFNVNSQWVILDIEAKYPIIDSPVSEKFLPQETNMQKFNAISFHKGCYLGQEIIAKSYHKGYITRVLCHLSGNINNIPLAGDKIECKLNKSWRIAGTVLIACRLYNNHVWVQAVLNSNLVTNKEFRLQHDITGDKLICIN